MDDSKKEALASKARKLREGRLSRKYRNALGYIWSAALLVSIVSLVGYWAFVGRKLLVGDSIAVWGQFGDYLGGVIGTIVAAATLALVGVTVLIQIQVMNIARRQLQDSKRELALTRDEMKLSNAALRQQTFEVTFFRLLEQFRDYAMKVRIRGKSGLFAFTFLAEFISAQRGRPAASEAREKLASVYERVYSEQEQWLGPYFRMLYHLYKLIHQSFPADNDRRNVYGSMVRAQLSKGELLMIYYNLLNKRSERLRSYIEFYGVLKHLDRGDICMKESELGYVVAEEAFRDYEYRKLFVAKPPSDIGP